MTTAHQKFKNNAASTLSGTLAIGGTTLNLAVGTGTRFPSLSAGEYAYLTLYEKDGGGTEITYEIVKCTNITADTLTIVRDAEGIVVAAGGTSGGWAYPSAIGVNPSQVVYVELRYTAYAANNTLAKDGNLEGLDSASTARTNLGLGTIATQAANNVAITGGTISGVSMEDSSMTFTDNADPTKKMQFQLSSIGTGLTRTVTIPNTDITLPGVNVANTWSAAQTFSSTLNKITLTAPATGSTITIADGKTLTVNNTLTFSGTDSSTLNIGTGGTLGTAAYTASTAYQAADADLTTWAGITPGTGVGTALAINVGTSGSFIANGGALGTPTSGTVTNLTGTASININGTVGATTPTTGAFTTLTAGTVGGTLGSLALKGTTSGTATFTTDATVTKVTLDKPLDLSSNAITSGAINKVTLTAPGTSATLTLANGSTFTTSGAYAWQATIPGAYTYTFPGATSTLAALSVAQSWTAEQTFKEVTDTVYAISDGAAFEIDPANGCIQTITLGASRTPKATNFAAGQTVLLGIDDGTAYSITWTDGTLSPTWVKVGGTASAPTLATTGYTWVLLWKVSSTIYACEVGKP